MGGNLDEYGRPCFVLDWAKTILNLSYLKIWIIQIQINSAFSVFFSYNCFQALISNYHITFVNKGDWIKEMAWLSLGF